MRVHNLTASYVAPTEAPFLAGYTAVVFNSTESQMTFTTASDADGTNDEATVIPANSGVEVVLDAYVKASAATGLVLLGN